LVVNDCVYVGVTGVEYLVFFYLNAETSQLSLAVTAIGRLL